MNASPSAGAAGTSGTTAGTSGTTAGTSGTTAGPGTRPAGGRVRPPSARCRRRWLPSTRLSTAMESPGRTWRGPGRRRRSGTGRPTRPPATPWPPWW